MNKYQEALDRLSIHIPNYSLINNHIVEIDKESDLEKLQELIDKETDRIKNEYENGWHNIKIQEHLEKIAKNSEQVGFDTLGSKHYKTDLNVVIDYLLEECEAAIDEVIGSWNDWSDEE